MKFFVISKINIIILKKFTIFNMIFENVGGVDHFGNVFFCGFTLAT